MGTKTTLNDLNEYLFQEMDRLTNEDLSMEDLDKEIKRSDALHYRPKNILTNMARVIKWKFH